MDIDLIEFRDLVVAYGTRVLLAILTLVVGLRVISWLVGRLAGALDQRGVDSSLKPFLKSLVGALLKVALIISIASMVGIETTSFVAVLGAAGVAIGLALSGTLQNFAGGVLILLLRPFKVGDYITAQGHSGTVREIQIFATILKTPDNVTVILPNGALSTGAVTNYSTEPQRRVDFVFGIGYDDDIDQAKAVLKRLFEADDRVLKDPPTAILLSELGDSSVNFVVRAWVNAADFWGVKFDLTERVKKEFDREGISIPYPQRDVHLYQHSTSSQQG